MPRTPGEILSELDVALRGVADVDPFDAISELVEDVLDSVALAMRNAGLGDGAIDEVIATASEYYAHHYQ